MNREILFRGKRVDGKGWTYGLLALNIRKEDSYVIQSPLHDSDGYRGYQQYEVITETIGEYTGFKDRTKVHIFEGDVVKNCRENYIVEYGIGKKVYGYQRAEFYPFQSGDYGIDNDGCVVIGNIWDNPELAEGKK